VSVIDGGTNSVVTDVMVGKIAEDIDADPIAINPNTNLIYVANQYSDTVSVIDGGTNSVVTDVTVARRPNDLAVNTDTNMIYVANHDANRVSVINGSTNTVIKTLTLGSYPHDMRGPVDIAVNHHTNIIYVTNENANRVSVIDGSTHSILKTILGSTPSAVDVNPATNIVYVANWLDDTVSVIDGSTHSILMGKISLEGFDQAGTSSDAIKVGDSPTDVDINPNTNKIYVANQDSNTISVIDGNSDSVINTIRVGRRPADLAFDSDTNYLYVVNSGSNTTSVIDTITDSVIDIIPMGSKPVGIAVDPIERWVYVADIGSNSIYQIDGATHRTEENFTVGYSPVDIALDQNTQMLYVTNLGREDQSLGSVSVISTSIGEVVNNFTIGGDIENEEDSIPTALAINSDTNMVYVADWFNDIVSVIDDYTDSIIANITAGIGPSSIAVNPKTNMIYVVNNGSNTVSIINGSTNSVVDDIPVGRYPVSIDVNPNTNLIYVANHASDTVSIINGSTNSVVAGITYNINPPDSGVVYCNRQKISNNDHKKYDIGKQIKCEAKANSVFPPWTFSSWSVFPPIAFDSWSGNLKSSDSANANNQNPNPTFEVSQYGTLTFNFKEFIPSEYIKMIVIPIILGLILSGITAWIAWLFTRRRRRYLGRYMKAIEAAYHTSTQNKEECFRRLSEIRRQITELFGRGKISESHYEILNEKISEYIEKVNK
jgi:YVTN family beta-propeller protein